MIAARESLHNSGTTFVRNHANAIVASDVLVAVTARFQLLYVLVILELSESAPTGGDSESAGEHATLTDV